MTAHIFSTLTCDHQFVLRGPAPAPGAIQPIVRRILIRGGTGVANKRTLITPRGVHTSVTDDELAILEQDPSFRRFVERGFLRVEKREADPEVVARDMSEDVGSAPLTPARYEDNAENGGPTVVSKKRGRKPKE